MSDFYFFKHPYKWIFLSLGGILLALLVFDAGIAVGERRERPRSEAPFSAYGVPLPHMDPDSDHGAVGSIESVHLPGSFTLMTRGNEEVSVLLTAATQLEPAGATSTLLSPGSHVVVIGDPEGTSSMQAQLVRVLPQ